MERMGFEKNKRLIRDFKNQPEEKYGYKFKSKFERRYADYLAFLVNQGQIGGWEYESEAKIFTGETYGVIKYIPDFKVWLPGGGGIEFHEIKGWAEGKDVTKMRRMQKHYPETPMVFVMMNPDKKRAKRYAAIRKYIKLHEIKYMASTFRKLGIK